jgi:methylmalonyl-CoA/ethylmalonyl-CoA epimerase
MKLSHIAIATADISKAMVKLEKINLKLKKQKEVPTEKVITAFIPIEAGEHMAIELLQPMSSESPISKFLEAKPKGGLHHLCFEVDNIEEWFQTLKDEKIEVLAPGIRISAHGRALFIHPKEMSGVLIELEQIQ